MSRKIVSLGAVVGTLLLALTFVPAHGAQGPSGPATGFGTPGDEEVINEGPIDELVHEYLSDEYVPGATVAVTKNSRLVWSKGYGYADTATNRHMEPETRTKIGSVSKLLTTIGALRRVEEGALDLDQPVYASNVAPLWGDDPSATPGVVFTPDGIFENPGDYLEAMVTGVDNLGAQLDQAAYEEAVNTTLDRAGAIRVKNVLSHTAGLVDSTRGAKAAAAEYFDTTEDDLTYEQLHQGVLMGLADAGAPFILEPGSEWEYSNFGFMVAAHIIAATSDEGDYRQYIQNRLLAPLGLFDVVPNNASISELDAVPYNSGNVPQPLDPNSVSRLLLGTGGWSASARDLARVMCSIDGTSNNLRSLEPATVDDMAADANPQTERLDAMGWDSNSSGELTKNGDLPDGGSSRVTKFLPGALPDGSDDEINVAVNVNKADSVPPDDLLRDIAEVVAEEQFPPDYDLFDPDFPCYVEPSLSLAAETPTPTRATGTTTADRAMAANTPERTTEDSDQSKDPETSAPFGGLPAPDDRGTPAGELVTDLRIDSSDLGEQGRDARSCGRRAHATVVATASDPSALGSVELGWLLRDQKGSAAMSQDARGRWSAPLGPFGPDTVPATEESVPVMIIVTATDHAGQSSTVEAAVTLHRCGPTARR